MFLRAFFEKALRTFSKKFKKVQKSALVLHVPLERLQLKIQNSQALLLCHDLTCKRPNLFHMVLHFSANALYF
jgi:hypothetical protein